MGRNRISTASHPLLPCLTVVLQSVTYVTISLIEDALPERQARKGGARAVPAGGFANLLPGEGTAWIAGSSPAMTKYKIVLAARSRPSLVHGNDGKIDSLPAGEATASVDSPGVRMDHRVKCSARW